MPRTRRYRSRWLFVPAIAIAVSAQGAVVYSFQATRKIPKPYLTIRLGEAASYWDYDIKTRTDKATSLSVFAPDTNYKITVDVPGKQMLGTGNQKFELPDREQSVEVTVAAPDGTSWSKRIDVHPLQAADVGVSFTPARGQILVTRAGDTHPLLRCSTEHCGLELEPGTPVQLTAVPAEGATFEGYSQYPIRTPKELVPYLGDPLEKCAVDDIVEAATTRNVYDCAFTVKSDVDVAVEFGKPADRVDVAIQDVKLDDVLKPLVPKPLIPPTPIDAEKLQEKPPEVALKPPPKPPEIKPPQIKPPPPPPPEKKPPPPQPPQNMVMVEVKDDKNVKDKAPDDAKQLSDKNRDVDEETRAQKTNLDKESDGKSDPSKENDTKLAEVGGPDDKIRQLEEAKATTDKHLKETDHSGKDEVAKGAIKGEAGNNGEEGTGNTEPGMLSMRGIEGRGKITDQTDAKKAGKKGMPGLNTPLAFNDYERLMGKEKIDEERQVSARKMSMKKGHWERKLDAIKSSLENFVPDVKPGNQTALKTRAHPFALFVARMHRRIHELWGFGFLEDLDSKPADYPLNDQNLWVNLEMSINPDGTIHKVTIAKTSGKTEFDVAAVDTVITAGPYEATPEAIRSKDGRVYLRWGFYRNWKQCGTFNVEPYILTEVPEDNGVGVLDDGAMVKNIGKLPKITGKRHPVGDKTVTPDDGKANQKVSPTTSVTDKQAVFSANLFVSAFATAEVDKLVKLSSVPFYASGKIAANSSAELKEMFSSLIVESGPMRDWKLLTPSEYSSGGAGLPDGNLVLQIQTTKEAFAVVLSKTSSGEYRATQLAR